MNAVTWREIAPSDEVETGQLFLLGFFGSFEDEDYRPEPQVGLWDGEQWNGDWIFARTYPEKYNEAQPSHLMEVDELKNWKQFKREIGLRKLQQLGQEADNQ